jgi:hypothetical protein
LDALGWRLLLVALPDLAGDTFFYKDKIVIRERILTLCTPFSAFLMLASITFLESGELITWSE